MNVIKTLVKSSWGWSRWIRLAIGIAFLFDAYYKSAEMVAFMGAFLVYQSVFNVGCGFGNSCSPKDVSSSKTFDISHNFVPLNNKKQS